jgi:hypothetical protein
MGRSKTSRRRLHQGGQKQDNARVGRLVQQRVQGRASGRRQTVDEARPHHGRDHDHEGKQEAGGSNKGDYGKWEIRILSRA